MSTRIIAVALGFVLSVSFPILAQEKPMTNRDVLALTGAGISETVVITRIRAQKNTFDLSTNGLVALKKAGVSDAIISEMMGIQSTPAQATAAASSAAPTPPVVASETMVAMKKYTWAEPETHGAYWEAGGQLVAIPRQQCQLTANKTRAVLSGGGVLGAVGVHTRGFTRLQGPEAKLRVASDGVFVLRMVETRIPNIKLVKLEIKQMERQAEVSGKVYSSQTSEVDGIAFALVKLKAELYRLVPKTPLDKGEYALIDVSAYNQSSLIVFDFGVN